MKNKEELMEFIMSYIIAGICLFIATYGFVKQLIPINSVIILLALATFISTGRDIAVFLNKLKLNKLK